MADLRLEGVVRMVHPVVFDADASGFHLEVSVGGRDGVIALPRLPEPEPVGADEPELVVPEVNFIEDPELDRSWGRVLTKEKHFLAEAAYLSISLPHSEDQFEEARRADLALREWLSDLFDWLRVITGQDLRNEGPFFWEAAEATPGLFHLKHGEEDLGPYFNASGHPPPYPGTTACSKDEWAFCLKKASTTQKPDEARILLHDAMGNLDRKRPRRALLDAVLAAEVVLTRALMERLQEQNEAMMISVLLDRATLGRKLTLAQRFAVWCPQLFSTRVVRARNRVLHEGWVPTSEEAREAIVEVEKLRLHHFPAEGEVRYDPADDGEDA